MNKIVVVDNGNVPSHILDMAKQKGIEICVEKDYIGRPEITEAMVIPLNQSYIPDYSYLSETHTGHGKGGRTRKKISKDRKKNKNKKTHRKL